MTLRLTHFSSSKLCNALRAPVRPNFAMSRPRFNQFSRVSNPGLHPRSRPTFGSNAWRTTGLVGVATVGLGLAGMTKPAVMCDASAYQSSNNGPGSTQNTEPSTKYEDLPPPPQSAVSLYELSFGTVCGLCAGIFIKKGVKAAAFLLGGVFVLLQYLGSGSYVRVDWGRVARRFETIFYNQDAQGVRRPPNVLSLWRWMVDFLVADFQPRASFIAGLALGLRIG